MKAREYVDAVRLDDPPIGPPVSLADRRSALEDAFRGVDLGRYDKRLIDTLAELLLDEPVRGLVSLVLRSRIAPRPVDWLEGGSGSGMPMPRLEGPRP